LEDRSHRRTPRDEANSAPHNAFREDGSEEAPPPIIRADLAGLSDPDPAPRTGNLSGDALSRAHEFLGAFSRLLASVASGDVSAARNAATELQLELFGGSGALAAAGESGKEAQTRMLDDLVALIRFARLGELGSAEVSAHLLARDMQAALLAPARAPTPAEPTAARRRIGRTSLPEPASLVQGATAAYEMLMDLDPGANAA
jgi:hypothetical protein